MAGISLQRVVVGGTVAAVIILAGALLTDVLFVGAVTDALAAAGATAPQGPGLVGILAVFLVGGWAMVWLYAAVAPRFGPGPGTAIRVGLVLWFFGLVGPNTALHVIGIIPASVFLIQVLSSLVYVNAGAIAGAWLYREEGAAAPAPPAAEA